MLEDGTGVEFLNFATQLVTEKGANMPFVISISGNTIAEQREMYRSHIVNDFMQKPIVKQNLLDILQIM